MLGCTIDCRHIMQSRNECYFPGESSQRKGSFLQILRDELSNISEQMMNLNEQCHMLFAWLLFVES